jgi:hypothetical protein
VVDCTWIAHPVMEMLAYDVPLYSRVQVHFHNIVCNTCTTPLCIAHLPNPSGRLCPNANCAALGDHVHDVSYVQYTGLTSERIGATLPACRSQIILNASAIPARSINRFPLPMFSTI